MILVISITNAGNDNKILAPFGTTYPIVEPDALEEIERRVSSIDWEKKFIEPLREQYKNYRPQDVVSLPKAEGDRIYETDPTFTLEHDIPDGKGGVVYPAGYRYNPLDYFNLPNTLVVINAEGKEQLGWLGESGYIDDPKVTLLVTEGSAYELALQLKRPVYYLSQKLARRLGINTVPAIIKQTGSVFRIREIYVEKHPAD